MVHRLGKKGTDIMHHSQHRVTVRINSGIGRMTDDEISEGGGAATPIPYASALGLNTNLTCGCQLATRRHDSRRYLRVGEH